jgi:hypothetical protein
MSRTNQRAGSGATAEDRRFPRGIRHVTFFGLFFIFSFAAFGFPFWYLMRDVLPRSASLANESAWFSPPVLGVPSVDYAGFGIPLAVSAIAVLALFLEGRGEARRPTNGALALLVLLPVSFLVSQYTVVGIFVSVGLTDPILLVAFSVFLYNYTLHRPRTRALLLAYPLGFLLGFMSDLESLNYFGGVFGGYGFGDGDFVFPLSFVVGTLLLSLTWRPILDRTSRLEAWFDQRIRRVRLSGQLVERCQRNLPK